MTRRNTSREPLLEVRDLRTSFYTASGVVRAVDSVSFTLETGEVLGLVGESGCGKSVTALSLIQLVPYPPGRIESGEIWFDGEDLLRLSETEMRRVRGSKIAMIFQEPMSSLNPVLTIERQLTEPLELHLGMDRRAARRRALELLEMVDIPDADQRLRGYPHELSGGQRQRVMVAIALSCNPKLLIADEATTALDVTIQAQVLELMQELTTRLGTSLMIITHNLGIVARYADRVNVMYAGKIRESGRAVDLYRNANHPYTEGLLHSVPRLDTEPQDDLDTIEGEIPDLMNLPTGCAFRPRCPLAEERCSLEDPPLMKVGQEHLSACWVRAGDKDGETAA